MLVPGSGGVLSQIIEPVYASEAVGNCRGIGAQLDFSVALRSIRLKLIPHLLTPFLYLIVVKGIAISKTHLSGSFFTFDTHLLSQLRSTLPPLNIVPSHWAPAALTPKENPFV